MSILLSLAALAAVGGHEPIHGCPERPHHPDAACDCTIEADFYRPGPPAGPFHVQAPGIRVRGRPVHLAGPVIHVQGPPVWVDAPPVHVAPAQIYIQRPDVRVRPSEVIVAPPEVHFGPCPGGGSSCPPGRY